MGAQVYTSVSYKDQEEQSGPQDWYEFDPRLASVGLLARAGVHYRPPRFSSLISLRVCAVILLCSWLITLLGLFFAWMFCATLLRRSNSLNASRVPFLSEFGLGLHRSFYSAGSTTSALFYFLTVLGERILRSQRVMSEATHEHILWVSVGALDVLAALLAATALALPCLSANVAEHTELHTALLAFFVVAVGASGLLQTAEVHHLWHDHPDRRALQAATLLKAISLGGANVSAVASWGLYSIFYEDAQYSASSYRYLTVSAVLQWASCFLLSGYFATLVLDVWPAARHRPLAHRALATSQGVHSVYLVGRLDNVSERQTGAPDYVPLSAAWRAHPSVNLYAPEKGSGVWYPKI